MRLFNKYGVRSLLIGVLTAVSLNQSIALDAVPAAAPPITTVLWTAQKDGPKLQLIIPGQKDPVTTLVSDSTIFGGICLDCNLPMEFKTSQSGKSCAVCGCAATNAACLVGKSVKTNSWQAMLTMLPAGTGLLPTFNEVGKPESGLKKLMVSLRSILLPVSGIENQTPEQLAAIVKPVGGANAKLLDGGKLLTFTLKTDWTLERAAKLNKAIETANGKIVVPDVPKAAP